MKFKYVYTRLYVKDCRACYKFYHDILGLKATFASEIDSYVELTDGQVKLTLLNQNKVQEYLGTKTDFSFEQPSDSQYLKEQGVEIVSPPWNVIDWGMKLALIRDPEGNLIELSEMGAMTGAE
jgi:predicted enzyme related to lactoylglutathione lyase